MLVLVGFSGAVEDGVRNMGMVISLVAALLAGWLFSSWAVGIGVFIVGNVIGFAWAARAGEEFRRQAFGDVGEAEREEE